MNISAPLPSSEQIAGDHLDGHDTDDDNPGDHAQLYLDWHSPRKNRIENNIDDRRWTPFIQIVRPVFLNLLDDFADEAGYNQVSLSVLWADDRRMKALNSHYKNKESSTNILSFSSEDFSSGGLSSGAVSSQIQAQKKAQPTYIGDLILAFETVMSEAKQQEITPIDHIAHLCIHGMLHLVGHDHQTDENARIMEAIETRLLAQQGIKNPYDEDVALEGEDQN